MTLIVGGDSLIGGALAADFKSAGREFVATTRRPGGRCQLDLSAPPDSWQVPQCDAAVFCAAMTKLADCEREPELARRVNVEGTAALAARLHEMGAYVLLLSTNLVFDGEQGFSMASEPLSPATVYGRLKAEAEAAVAGMTDGRAGVLRLTKVFGRGDRRLNGWAEAMKSGRSVEAFSGVPLAPVGLAAVVNAVRALLDARAAGACHFSASEDVTWFEVAERVADRCGADRSLVRPSGPGGIGQSFPRHSALGMGVVEESLGLFPQNPWIAVEEALV